MMNLFLKITRDDSAGVSAIRAKEDLDSQAIHDSD